MLCPWWLLKAGQCCLRLSILKSFPHSFFLFFVFPPPSKIHTCARDVTSLGTIKWISALIAWLMGFCSNNYMEGVTTDTRKRKIFLPLNYCSDFTGKPEVCRPLSCWGRLQELNVMISEGRTICLVEPPQST